MQRIGDLCFADSVQLARARGHQVKEALLNTSRCRVGFSGHRTPGLARTVPSLFQGSRFGLLNLLPGATLQAAATLELTSFRHASQSLCRARTGGIAGDRSMLRPWWRQRVRLSMGSLCIPADLAAASNLTLSRSCEPPRTTGVPSIRKVCGLSVKRGLRAAAPGLNLSHDFTETGVQNPPPTSAPAAEQSALPSAEFERVSCGTG